MKRLLFALLVLSLSLPVWADCIFREDTASQTFLIGPFLDGTDGITAETSITPANTDIRISKNGANTIDKNSGGCTHDEAGMFQCTFDATDTDTAGMLQIYTDNSIDATSIVPVFHECIVYAAEYFDLLDGTTSIMTSRQAGNMLETTVSTVNSQTDFDLTVGASNNDAYNFSTVEFVGGTEECIRTVIDYIASGNNIIIDSACPFTVAGSDTVRLHIGSSGKAVDDVRGIVAALNDVSLANIGIELDSSIAAVGLDHIVSIQGSSDSGTSTTLVDAALTQPDFYWNNTHILVVQFATGPEARCVRGFTASSDTLSVVPAFSQAVATEDYILIPSLTCRNFP